MKTKLKEYFKNMSNTKKIAISVLAMVFVCLVFTGSYALFTTKIANRTYVVKVGTLDIDFEDANSNLIVLNNTYPMTNNEGLATTGYTFNVSNNGTVPGKYLVRLEIADDNEIPIEYIKVAYQKTKDESINVSSPSLSTPKLLSNLNDSLVVFKDESIGVGKKDTINLKLWLDINAPNDVQNKSFKARIIIDSTQDYEDASYAINTKPIIELNKNENGNIDQIIPVNGTYTELGVASVKDDKDKLTPSDVTITGTVDTTTAGTYTKTYTVTDSDNNTSVVTRTIYVGDEESLNIKHSISDVLAMYTQQEQSTNEAIVCSHIYGNGDLYLDCSIEETLEDAIDVRNRSTIIITKNLIKANAISLESNKDIILELNGKAITSSTVDTESTTWDGTRFHFRLNGSSLVVNDRIGTGGIYTGNDTRPFFPRGNSNLVINGGSYSGRQTVQSDTAGNNYIEINGGTFNEKLYSIIYIAQNDIVVINGGTFTSTNSITINNISSGIININGGTFISNNNITINNNSSGRINITQTDMPIYITSKAEAWKPVIYNNGENGIINIKGQQANACTNNAGDTTSGLCVYAEGNQDPSSNNGNLAVVNGAGKAIYIDGGTYYGCRNSVCNNSSGKIYIMNAILNSDSSSLINNTGEVYICNSTLNKSIYQYDNESAKIYYANDVVFASGTNTPNIAYGTFISNYTCPAEWTIE